MSTKPPYEALLQHVGHDLPDPRSSDRKQDAGMVAPGQLPVADLSARIEAPRTASLT
jgi:hypothetical protein